MLAILVCVILCFAMTYPHLPGRFDASAGALSFVAQTISYASLLLVPIGLGWMVSPRRFSLWCRLALVSAGLGAIVATVGAISQNQLALGMALGVAVLALLRLGWGRIRTVLENGGSVENSLRLYLVFVPFLLVAFREGVVPRAADWSRDRAIVNSAPLIAEIESHRQRRGVYPDSLESLNPDFPTGVVGIERFQYEKNGDAYNLFFFRTATELDAMEVVLFNPRDEHRFTSHELDILQYDGEQLERRRGDRRRTPLTWPHWISILFD